jgi:hypothetical protein
VVVSLIAIVCTVRRGVLRPIHRGILEFCGFSVLTPFIAYSPARITPEERKAFLDQVPALLPTASLPIPHPLASPPASPPPLRSLRSPPPSPPLSSPRCVSSLSLG